MKFKQRIILSCIEALNSLAKRIQKLSNRLLIDTDEKLDYSSLSPVANADPQGDYTKALHWALKNRKKEDIKNIAMTGPYGSGKSSILKTFQENYKGGDLKFLNISLATFKDEKTKLDRYTLWLFYLSSTLIIRYFTETAR